MMDFTVIFMFSSTLLFLCSPTSCAPAASPPLPTPTPAPAPAPAYVNLTQLLSVAGPFQTFLGYLESTKVIDILQAQANDTQQGLTLFVPKNTAFSSLKNPSLSNLTQGQLKSVCLFHALPYFNSLAGFNNLSKVSPVATLAGGQYTLNFTDESGTVHLSSGWTRTVVSSAVLSTNPVAVYQINSVLLPEAIFGTDIPPTPAPSPAPEIAPAADAEKGANGTASASTSSPASSSSYRIAASLGAWSQLVLLAVSGGVALFF